MDVNKRNTGRIWIKGFDEKRRIVYEKFKGMFTKEAVSRM